MDGRPRRSMTLTAVNPMSPRRVNVLPAGRDWTYEARIDGLRAVIYKDESDVTIRARGERDLEQRYPEVFAAAAKINAPQAIVDGVIVVDKDESAREREVFYAMDVMRTDGRDLRAAPLSERRARLSVIIANTGLRPVQLLNGSVAEILLTAQDSGLTGVVAKRTDSCYRSGRDGDDWLELRFRREQSFLVGGYVAAGLSSVDALIIGVRDAGVLRFAARVHEGLVGEVRQHLRQQLDPLRIAECPFVDCHPPSFHIDEAIWVAPELEARIGFAQWISQWRVSSPTFLSF